MIAIKILTAIYYCFYIYMLMICARCLLTWIPGINWSNPFFAALKSSVDLYLDLFKKFIPPLGPFDFSPIVAMFVLAILQNVIMYGTAFILSAIGLGIDKIGG